MRENRDIMKQRTYGQDNKLVIEGRNAVLEAFRSGNRLTRYLYWMDVRTDR